MNDALDEDLQVKPTTPKKQITARRVKRMVARIEALTEDKARRKKKNKLAVTILTRMAAGEIRNPAAVARAFIGGGQPEVAEGADAVAAE